MSAAARRPRPCSPRRPTSALAGGPARGARGVTDLPLLRKDFTVDPYQLYEAKSAGADAVLLVVGSVDRRDLSVLHGLAGDLDLDALVEVSTAEERPRSRSTPT